MTSKYFQLKNDAYRRARGGKAELFTLICRNCQTKILLYQKDDPHGLLKRLYLDRIFAPSAIKNRQHLSIKSVPILKCENCQHIVGVPYIYPKEKRKAYMVEVGSIIKKKSKGIF